MVVLRFDSAGSSLTEPSGISEHIIMDSNTIDTSVEKVLTIGDLRKALEQYDDNDQVVVEIHEGVRHEDLYTFYVDHMDGLLDVEGNEFKEVRLCI
jgi:hypothetical protein